MGETVGENGFDRSHSRRLRDQLGSVEVERGQFKDWERGMETASGPLMEIGAQPLAHDLHTIPTSLIEPGEDRSEGSIALVQQYATVQEAANTNGFHRRDDVEPAHYFSKLF